VCIEAILNGRNLSSIFKQHIQGEFSFRSWNQSNSRISHTLCRGVK
jgi:hypothetical protein